jgi:hypothetical protein
LHWPAESILLVLQLTHLSRVNEERLDELKLEYIANRSEKGRQAVDALIAERRLKLLKLAGKKDEASVLQAEIEARKRAA